MGEPLNLTENVVQTNKPPPTLVLGEVARHFSVVTEGARFRQREFSITFVGVGLDRPAGFMPKLDVTRGRAMLAPTIFTYLKRYAKNL